MSRYRFLVTGTGRCGTTFVSRWARHYGLDLSHDPKSLQDVGADGCASWALGSGIRPPARFWTGPMPRFERRLQVVRHPLLVVGSLCAHADPEYQAHAIGMTGSVGENTLTLYLTWWLRQVGLCRWGCDLTVPIKDEVRIAEFLGIGPVPPDLPRDTKPEWRRGIPAYLVTWEDVRALPLADWIMPRLMRACEAIGIDPDEVPREPE